MYVCMNVYQYVGLSTGNPYKKYVCQNAWVELHGHNMRMLKVSFGQLKPTCDTRTLYARAALAWTKNIEIKNLKRTELQRLNNRGAKG